MPVYDYSVKSNFSFKLKYQEMIQKNLGKENMKKGYVYKLVHLIIAATWTNLKCRQMFPYVSIDCTWVPQRMLPKVLKKTSVPFFLLLSNRGRSTFTTLR